MMPAFAISALVVKFEQFLSTFELHFSSPALYSTLLYFSVVINLVASGLDSRVQPYFPPLTFQGNLQIFLLHIFSLFPFIFCSPHGC